MSNESENKRIDLTKIETFLESAGQESGGRFVYDLIAELKRCYEELDELPTRRELMDISDYQKWLEYVESYFLADGSFNQDADFVRKCAVNNKYGYRIEVIDGVETVVHESEY